MPGSLTSGLSPDQIDGEADFSSFLWQSAPSFLLLNELCGGTGISSIVFRSWSQRLNFAEVQLLSFGFRKTWQEHAACGLCCVDQREELSCWWSHDQPVSSSMPTEQFFFFLWAAPSSSHTTSKHKKENNPQRTKQVTFSFLERIPEVISEQWVVL